MTEGNHIPVNTPPDRLAAWISGDAARFDARLAACLAAEAQACPPRLAAAMRHSVLAGGKRLRPYLVIESARLFGLVGKGPDQVAAALEMVHCYSLVHDDLPAMDDDDLRRGQPTVHKAFDDATAILAGDGLLTMAFSVLSHRHTSRSAAVRLRLVEALAEASGVRGMVGGQMLDLAAEGRFAGGAAAPLTAEGIIAIQALKTGALISFAAQAGALMVPRLPVAELAQLRSYGEALGLAFQIRDDLIDVESDAATAGKATGKDSAAGKGTFVSLLGVEGARRRLDEANMQGEAALTAFGKAADPLRAVLDFNRIRRS